MVFEQKQNLFCSKTIFWIFFRRKNLSMFLTEQPISPIWPEKNFMFSCSIFTFTPTIPTQGEVRQLLNWVRAWVVWAKFYLMQQQQYFQASLIKQQLLSFFQVVQKARIKSMIFINENVFSHAPPKLVCVVPNKC